MANRRKRENVIVWATEAEMKRLRRLANVCNSKTEANVPPPSLNNFAPIKAKQQINFLAIDTKLFIKCETRPPTLTFQGLVLYCKTST